MSDRLKGNKSIRETRERVGIEGKLRDTPIPSSRPKRVLWEFPSRAPRHLARCYRPSIWRYNIIDIILQYQIEGR